MIFFFNISLTLFFIHENVAKQNENKPMTSHILKLFVQQTVSNYLLPDIILKK